MCCTKFGILRVCKKTSFFCFPSSSSVPGIFLGHIFYEEFFLGQIEYGTVHQHFLSTEDTIYILVISLAREIYPQVQVQKEGEGKREGEGEGKRKGE